jgi:hypothetical protein
MDCKATITLEITYDNEEYMDPDRWDWAELLDLPDRDHVKIIDFKSYGAVE